MKNFEERVAREAEFENWDFDRKMAFKHYLSDFITDNKKRTIERVLSQRTKHFTAVFEDLYKPHNISASIRTLDCFGVQEAQIIEYQNTYRWNPFVLRGAGNWITVNKYRDREGAATRQCLEAIKKRGYKILVTVLNQDSRPIDEINICDKSAIVFGTEFTGVSSEAIEAADELIHIPMYGFTESFNVSVSVSIIFSQLVQRMRESEISWQITEMEKEELRFQWYVSLTKNLDVQLRHFLQNI